MKTEQDTPHGKVFNGTLAQVAIQCNCPDTEQVGCFLFTTQSHRNKGTRCSPVFADLAELFLWAKANNWLQDSKLGYRLTLS